MAKLPLTCIAVAMAMMIASTTALVDPSFKPDEYVIDFDKFEKLQAAGGSITAVNAKNAPVIAAVDFNMVLVKLECQGTVPIHLHPRADEAFFVLSGTIRACFAEETGGQTICNDFPTGTAGFFPQAVIHFQEAVGGEPASFIATLNNVDAGTTLLLDQLFTLPDEVLASSFNTSDTKSIDAVRDQLPDPPFLATVPLADSASDALAENGSS